MRNSTAQNFKCLLCYLGAASQSHPRLRAEDRRLVSDSMMISIIAVVEEGEVRPASIVRRQWLVVARGGIARGRRAVGSEVVGVDEVAEAEVGAMGTGRDHIRGRGVGHRAEVRQGRRIAGRCHELHRLGEDTGGVIRRLGEEDAVEVEEEVVVVEVEEAGEARATVRMAVGVRAIVAGVGIADRSRVSWSSTTRK